MFKKINDSLKLSLTLPAVLLLIIGSYENLFAQDEQSSHKEFASVFLKKMRLSEADKTERLIEATAYYLDKLEIILAERADTLNQIENNYKLESEKKDSLIVKAYDVARDKYLPLKKDFVTKLDDDLSSFQVDRVKDGLTHDRFHTLHAMYLEMVPMLQPTEKAHILTLLVEGRENAMLAISEEGQSQWWDKYRGIINNYIAAQGYDFGSLSKKWDEEHNIE